MTMRCADGRPPVPARSGPACAATCGSTAKRCAAPRRGGRTPMLLSGIWDDGTTAAQLPVDKKTNEIPVFRELLEKIPAGDLEDAVITADQMHTQRKHARQIRPRAAY